MATQTNESPKQFLGVEFASDTDLETVFTPTIPAGCNHVCMQALENSVLWRPDGETPSDGEAFVMLPTQYVDVHQTNPEDLRFIRGSVGAKLALAYYR